MNKEVEDTKKDDWISDELISKEQIKRVKETLHEFDNYYSDEAIDENENVIDEEADELANIFNDAWYYIEQLERKVKELENQLADSTPNSVIREKIEKYKNLIKECSNDEEHLCEIPLYEHDRKILEKILKEGKSNYE